MQGRRVAMGATLALSISSLALLGGGTAFAKAPPKPKGKTQCSTMTGTATTTVVVSGCVDALGANTGGATTPLPVATLAGGGTVTWVSTKTTTFSAAVLVGTKATKCPGYVKVKKGQTAPAEPTALKISGTVSADTSGMKVPGKYKGAICLSSTGVITALKPLKVN